MLDKELCKSFNVDDFQRWVIDELDRLEDMLFDGKIKLKKKEREKIAVQITTLKTVRDVYCSMKRKREE